jgi:hypothetical protein
MRLSNDSVDLSPWSLSKATREAASYDVQGFSFTRLSKGDYAIIQRPHWLPPRVFARVSAANVRDAVKRLHELCAEDNA